MIRFYADAKDGFVYLTRCAIARIVCSREQVARFLGVAICLVALAWMAVQPEVWFDRYTTANESQAPWCHPEIGCAP